MTDVEIMDSLLISVEEYIMWNKNSPGKVTLSTNLMTERGFDFLDLLELIEELERKFSISFPGSFIISLESQEEEITIENIFYVLKTAVINRE
jgi:acyl carrier protein